MSSTKSVYSRKTEEEPEDQLGRDGGRLEAGRNTVRANNIDQSVVANNVAPNGDISFASEDRDTSSQPGSASYQSINADSVRVNGRIIYNSHHYYSDHRGRLEIPKWLSTLSVLSFDRKHRDTIEIFRKTPETGRWLLNHRDFLAWKNGSMRRVLCPGIPGAGKTVLASIVINHLQTSINQDTTACLFIYFDYRKHAQYTVRDLYMSLLAQLLKHRSHFSKETDNAFENFNKKAIIPSEVEVTEMLMAEMTSFSRVYIVIDALDECGVDSTRGEFLCTIRRFPANVSTLMTSRAGKEASSGVEADIEIPITAHDEDLKTYLDGRLHDPALGKLQALVGQGTDQFWNKALDTIIKKSEGMFLLAQLHMDYLVGNCNYTVLGFKESLCALPQTPDDVYQSTLERIAKQPEFKQTLAIRSLGWLIHTKRPLTISELLEAVAVEPNTREYGSLRIVPSEVLTSVCAGIIVVDAATKVVRLAHYTAAQYLREKERTRFQSFHSDIAKTCLTYLLLDDFGAPSSIPTRSNRTATDRRKKYSLLDYAANHWGDHVAAGPVGGEVHKLAYELLTGDEGKRVNAYQSMSSDARRRFLTQGVSGLHVAAYFGAHNLAQKLLKKQIVALNTTTSEGETALHWASRHNQLAVLKLLVDNGADVNIIDKTPHKHTALHRAVVHENHDAVAMLFARGPVSVDVEDAHRWTPLRYSAAYGLYKMVETLLNKGAQIDAEDSDGWTALRWAANRGHRVIVELLIQRGASLQSPKNSKEGWTLLSWAAREGRMPFVKLLVEKKEISLDALHDGETALHGAVRYGRSMVVFLLLQAGAKINTQDTRGKTPLHAAVESLGDEKQERKTTKKPAPTRTSSSQSNISTTGNNRSPATGSDSSVLWLLLESGADIDAQTKLGFTALHAAASRGLNSIAWLLLEKGADASLQDNTGKTALQSAVDGQNDEIIRLLMRHDALLVRHRDNESRTALHDAASAGHLSTLKLLLKSSNCDVDARDYQNCTALHRAVVQGHTKVVAYLIEKGGADTTIRNKKKKTASDEARDAGNENMIDLFNKRSKAVNKDTTTS